MEWTVHQCRNQEVHRGKWTLENPEHEGLPLGCLACMTKTLGDQSQLWISKKAVIHSLLQVLERCPQLVLKCIKDHTEVIHRVFNAFMETLCCADDNTISAASQCILILLCQFNSEHLGLFVVKRLVYLVENEKDYLQSLPKLRIVGCVLKMHPSVTQAFQENDGRFLRYLCDGLNSRLKSTVKCSILFIFVHAYKSGCTEKHRNFAELCSKLMNYVLPILKSCEDKDQLTNALGLFSVLIHREYVEIPDFAACAKASLLFNDTNVQICMAQCISQAALKSEQCLQSLMHESIPEFLFELLTTTNDLLIESLLCSISCFTKCQSFYTKFHAIYGMEIILQTTTRLLSTKNWHLSTISLKLLDSILSSEHYHPSVTPQDSVFQRIVKMLLASFEANMPQLLLAAVKFFTGFLKKENLPWPMPLSSVENSIKACLKAIKRYLHSAISNRTFKYSLEKSLNAGKLPMTAKVYEQGLNVASSMSRLAREISDQKLQSVTMEEAFSCPNIETESKAERKDNAKSPQDKLLKFAVLALDDIFVPFLFHFRPCNIMGKTLCGQLVVALSAIYEEHWKTSDTLYCLTEKIIQSGLFKVFLSAGDCQVSATDVFTSESKNSACDSCLKYIFWSYLEKEENVNEGYLKSIEMGIAQLTDSFETCIQVLSQNSYEEGFGSQQSQIHLSIVSSQSTVLLFTYTLYKQNNMCVPVTDLLPHLICYANGIREQDEVPLLSMKHLSFLLATCTCKTMGNKNYKSMLFTLEEANISILSWLSSLPSFSVVYEHHSDVLWWCFIYGTPNMFASYVLQQWLSRCTESSCESFYLLIQLLSRNEFAQASFMSTLESDNFDRVREAVSFLKNVWINLAEKNDDSGLLECFKSLLRKISDVLPTMLIKYFLSTNETCSDTQGSKVMLLLDCLCWCQLQLSYSSPVVDMGLKLVFHVTNFCCRRESDLQIVMQCLTYLECILSKQIYSIDHRAWQIISGNSDLTALIEKCTVNSQWDVCFFSIKFLLAATGYQMRNRVQCREHVNIPLATVFDWLKMSEDIRRMTFSLLNFLILAKFQNTFVAIIPSSTPDPAGETNTGLYLSRTEIQEIVMYLQNAAVQNIFDGKEVVVSCLLNLIDFVSIRDRKLVNYIILNPWSKIMLEQQLISFRITDEHTWSLFNKWLSYDQTNPCMAEVVKNFAELIALENSIDPSKFEVLEKLCDGTYNEFVLPAIKEKLRELVQVKPTRAAPPKNRTPKLLEETAKLVYSSLGISDSQDAVLKKSTRKRQRKTKA